MYSFEQALEDARFFEKNVNHCQEYEDAWIFQNTKKRWGRYNPIVIYKDDGEATPYYMYEPAKRVRIFKIDKNGTLQEIVSFEKDNTIEKKEKDQMTNKELTQIRESLSLTKKDFAERIGSTAMMIGRYEKGNCEIPENVAMAVKALLEPVEDDVASFIKGVRENLNVSKSAFAKLIGVSATMAGNYESGKSKPKDEILEKIKGLIDNAEKAASEAPAAPSAPVDEDIAVAPVDEKKEEPAPVAEKKSEEPAPKKKKSAPAKKKAKEPAPVDEEKAEEKSSAPAAAPVDEKKTVSIVIESQMGGSITTEEVISRLPDGVDTVYIKPEENAAYWVKGSESGVVNLW